MSYEEQMVDALIKKCFQELQVGVAILERTPWDTLIKAMDKAVEDARKRDPVQIITMLPNLMQKRAVFSAADSLVKAFQAGAKTEKEESRGRMN